jgi:hypothetical protein
LRSFCNDLGCGLGRNGNFAGFRRWSFFHRALSSLDDAYASLYGSLFLRKVFVPNLLRQLF